MIEAQIKAKEEQKKFQREEAQRIREEVSILGQQNTALLCSPSLLQTLSFS